MSKASFSSSTSSRPEPTERAPRVSRGPSIREEAPSAPQSPPSPSRVPSANDRIIADHMLGDQPAKTHTEDRLGFTPYVAAVAKFLTDSSTKIPLTLAIEGTWGTGKSSFMLQLVEALTGLGKSKIVQFNAWQYNADEGLWAAFLHEFDDKLHEKLRWYERIRARWKLFLLRARWQGWTETIMALVVTAFWLVAAGLAVRAVAFYLDQGGLKSFKDVLSSVGKPDESLGKSLGAVGGIGGAIISLTFFFHKLRDLFKSPASLKKTRLLFAKPNYDSKLPLIHELTRDFNSLVEAYAGDESVYVFIDDLDRCEYTKAADLMQALLVLLSSAPKVALIIGLDREKVAAAMATKQEKLIPYLYQVAPGESYLHGLEYGQRFLEKFIQVSFFLPQPNSQGLKAMINPGVNPAVPPVPESEKSKAVINIVTGKDDSETLNKMIEMADEVFGHNPRNVKQFVNMFRLHAFIANETGLFGSSRRISKTGAPLSIPQIGKFVILSMRWPGFIDDAIDHPDLISDLEAPYLSTALIPELPADRAAVCNTWKQQRGLVDLMKFGLNTNSKEFSLAAIDFELLNEIAPSIRPIVPVNLQSTSRNEAPRAAVPPRQPPSSPASSKMSASPGTRA